MKISEHEDEKLTFVQNVMHHSFVKFSQIPLHSKSSKISYKHECERIPLLVSIRNITCTALQSDFCYRQ